MRQGLKLQTQKNKLNMSTNNFSEGWLRWEPIANLAEKYNLMSVVDDINGFRVILADEKCMKSRISIFFKDSVWAYRNVDESFRLKIIGDLLEKDGSAFYGKWTLFKVKNSDYFTWLSEQSYEIFNTEKFTHFAILACDDILDVISNYEPEVTFFVENNNTNKN